MTTEEYIELIKENSNKRLHVVNVQCIAYQLYGKGYPKYTIANCLNVSNSHVNYMINTFASMIETNESVAVMTYEESMKHTFRIYPYFFDAGEVKEIHFALLIDKKEVRL